MPPAWPAGAADWCWSAPATTLLAAWEQMDNGDLREDQAFEAADAQVRARTARATPES